MTADKTADVDAIAEVESQIQRIASLNLANLRSLWRTTFGREAPEALTRDLLVRTLCWRLQEEAFGGHSPAILKLLRSYANARPGDVPRQRRLKAGTELVREFQGERHIVVITAEGFRWRDTDYPSLTAIARAITGTNWNGPRFFGLREGTDAKGVAVASPEARAKPKARKGQASGRAVQ